MLNSQALTLGRLRGAALIGQPLDLVVQVQMDAGEDVAALCLEADVFHADARQEGVRVRVLADATMPSQMAHVRILSPAIVDEPVVTVNLRTGCGQKTARRYVLLADLPGDVAVPALPLLVSPAAPVKAHPGLDAPEVGARWPQEPSPGAAPVPPAKATKSRPVAQSPRFKTKPQSPAARQSRLARDAIRAVPAAPGPRLKLAPVELPAGAAATAPPSPPAMPPELAVQTAQRMQTLEDSVKAGLALAAKNEASLLDLKARLQKAEEERFPGAVVYGLTALVLACLAMIAWLWQRQRRAPVVGDDWWRSSIALPVAPEAVSAPQSQPVQQEGVLQAQADHPAVSPDDLKEVAASPALTVALPSRQTRSLDTAAMPEVRQLAEFFVSLGQAEQAVSLLKHQIQESDAPNPFLYLELLSLLHAGQHASEFEQFRGECNRLFNVHVPVFSSFRDEGTGLESQGPMLSRITALWPTPQVLAVLEASLLRDPTEPGRLALDLAAFRELLLLHAVATKVVLEPGSEGDPARPLPLRGAEQVNAAQAEGTAQELQLADMLDLDLSDVTQARPRVTGIDFPLLASADGMAQEPAGR